LYLLPLGKPYRSGYLLAAHGVLRQFAPVFRIQGAFLALEYLLLGQFLPILPLFSQALRHR